MIIPQHRAQRRQALAFRETYHAYLSPLPMATGRLWRRAQPPRLHMRCAPRWVQLCERGIRVGIPVLGVALCIAVVGLYMGLEALLTAPPLAPPSSHPSGIQAPSPDGSTAASTCPAGEPVMHSGELQYCDEAGHVLGTSSLIYPTQKAVRSYIDPAILPAPSAPPAPAPQ